jgi:hypothetical protein
MDREGVDPDAYRLDGQPRDEALILEIEAGGWCVYFSERGLRNGEMHFDTEHDACEEMAQMLLRDLTNRYVLVVGPADPTDADHLFDAWLADHCMTRADLNPDDVRVDNPILREGVQSRRYWLHRKVWRGIV